MRIDEVIGALVGPLDKSFADSHHKQIFIAYNYITKERYNQ